VDLLLVQDLMLFRVQEANYALPPLDRETLVEGSNLLHHLSLGDWRCRRRGSGRTLLGVRQPLMRGEIALIEYPVANIASDSRHSDAPKTARHDKS